MSAAERLDRRGGLVEGLWPLAWLFGGLATLRGKLYDRGVLPSASVEAPVVCVGNIVAGGTGKTPVVVDLAQRFAARGWRPGVLVRGYGKAGVSGAQADEARLYHELLDDPLVVAEPDRIEGARRLIERGADVVLMDDGFQHRRLARDLDLVLVDATRPWGLARGPRAFLPRGLLREGPRALARASAIVLTRCDQAEPAALAALEGELERHAPGVPRLRTRHRPCGLRRLVDGAAVELAWLAGREVDSLAAIGAPVAFERTLEGLGARLVERGRLEDHHEFVARDLAGFGARPVVVTAKDAVKLRALEPSAELLVLDIAIEWLSGEGVLDGLVAGLPEGRGRRERHAFHEGLHG